MAVIEGMKTHPLKSLEGRNRILPNKPDRPQFKQTLSIFTKVDVSIPLPYVQVCFSSPHTLQYVITFSFLFINMGDLHVITKKHFLCL